MYSAYKLNKQGDNIQPWCAPFSIWNQSFFFMSSSNCCLLTCIQTSQEAGQVVWHSHLFYNIPEFVVVYTVEGFGTVNKAELDFFLELSWFFYHPTDFGNLTSGSSAFSKSSLNIWKFMARVLLEPGLENLEHYFTSVPFFGLEWKLSFFNPMANAEFSKFAGNICAHICDSQEKEITNKTASITNVHSSKSGGR